MFYAKYILKKTTKMLSDSQDSPSTFLFRQTPATDLPFNSTAGEVELPAENLY